MLYNIYIYNRKGKCLYYKEWSRPLNTLSDDPVEEKKLMFGMLFSLKDLVMKLSPITSAEGLHVMKTNNFTLHHFQSVTGLAFVINSTPDVLDLYQTLQQIYTLLYVDYIARNILIHRGPDDPIDNPIFSSKLDEYLKSLSLIR